MKRASYITLIAIVLLTLAAVGWILGLLRKPLAGERSLRRRRVKPVTHGAPLPIALAR
jgi:hypothetical protein